jgi:hypothetical protein
MACTHPLPSTWLSRQDEETELRIDWCPDCGATREQLQHYKQGDPPLDGAMFLESEDGAPAHWTMPKRPEIPELVCTQAPDGKHLWRDAEETLRCVVYECDVCGKRGAGDPGVPDVPNVPGRVSLEPLEQRHTISLEQGQGWVWTVRGTMRVALTNEDELCLKVDVTQDAEWLRLNALPRTRAL